MVRTHPQVFRDGHLGEDPAPLRDLNDAPHNDVVRLEPFFSVARHVADMDQKREKALAYVSNLSQEEQINTTQRIRENQAIVQWVQGSLQERVASYRVALERLVLAAPSASAVEAEPMVCDRLVSRILAGRRRTRKTATVMTAAGIEAEIVSPTRRPR